MANICSCSVILLFSCSTHNGVRSTRQLFTSLSGPSRVKERCGSLRVGFVRVIWDSLLPFGKGLSSHMELSARRIIPSSPSLHCGLPTMRQDSPCHSSGVPAIVTVNAPVSVASPIRFHLAFGTSTRHVDSCTPSSSYGTPMRNWISYTPAP